MCRLHTSVLSPLPRALLTFSHSEGTQHGCGHYVITRKVAKEDCRSKFCINSDRHAPDCLHCPNCKRYFDPDATETVTQKTPDYCRECEYWYKGPGARRR